MAIYAKATWEPLPANNKQARMTPRVVIIHRAVDAVGRTDLFGWFSQSGLESHFFVQLDGTVLQYMDTNVVAEANYKANGFAVSIETEDDGSAIPFTAAQVDALVRLVDWLCTTHNIPRQQANRWDGSGIGWHSMWGINTKAQPALNPWTSALGKDCPSAPRIAQVRDVIIPRLAGRRLEDDDVELNELLDSSVFTPDGRWVLTKDAIGSAPYASLLLERQVIPPLRALVAAVAALSNDPDITVTQVDQIIRRAISEVTPASAPVSIPPGELLVSLQAALASAPPEVFATFATAVNDEADRRDRERLGPDPQEGLTP